MKHLIIRAHAENRQKFVELLAHITKEIEAGASGEFAELVPCFHDWAIYSEIQIDADPETEPETVNA